MKALSIAGLSILCFFECVFMLIAAVFISIPLMLLAEAYLGVKKCVDPWNDSGIYPDWDETKDKDHYPI